MVSEGRGRLFKRPDDKYLIYLPVYLVQDSMFPFKDWHEGARGGGDSVTLSGRFIMGEKKLMFTSTPITGKRTVGKTVSGVCRLFKRRDSKYLIYLSKKWCEDSMFPFKGEDSILVKVSFERGVQRLIVEEWKEPEEQ
jgi:hypothetical protein